MRRHFYSSGSLPIPVQIPQFVQEGGRSGVPAVLNEIGKLMERGLSTVLASGVARISPLEQVE